MRAEGFRRWVPLFEFRGKIQCVQSPGAPFKEAMVPPIQEGRPPPMGRVWRSFNRRDASSIPCREEDTGWTIR